MATDRLRGAPGGTPAQDPPSAGPSRLPEPDGGGQVPDQPAPLAPDRAPDPATLARRAAARAWAPGPPVAAPARANAPNTTAANATPATARPAGPAAPRGVAPAPSTLAARAARRLARTLLRLTLVGAIGLLLILVAVALLADQNGTPTRTLPPVLAPAATTIPAPAVVTVRTPAAHHRAHPRSRRG